MNASATPPPASIPVTLLTGFLGSGKTTLLNHILKEQHGLRIAIIENELGDIGIDDALLNVNTKETLLEEGSGADTIIEMNNGCLCCRVRGDLLRILTTLIQRPGKPFDHILIETTGLADPSPVVQTFYSGDPELQARLHLNALITMVDVKHLHHHLETSPECEAQIAFADVLILNKTDLVDAPTLAQVEAALATRNPLAKRMYARHSVVDTATLLSYGGFNLEQTLARDPEFLRWATVAQATSNAPVTPEAHHHHHAGIPHTHDTPQCHEEACHHDHDHEHEHDHSQNHPSHSVHDAHLHGHHEAEVAPVCIELEGEVHPTLFQAWLELLVRTHASVLYRTKGILNIQGLPDVQYVIQGVHDMIDGQPGKPWADPAHKRNRLVFIGKKLDATMLREGFAATLVNPAS
ncbi:MAG: CobW family GTP-binding protein [Vampirovibrionales bacterium]